MPVLPDIKKALLSEQRFLLFGADGQTRTGTGLPTTPSRWRVYQFHHIGLEGSRIYSDTGTSDVAFAGIVSTAGTSDFCSVTVSTTLVGLIFCIDR